MGAVGEFVANVLVYGGGPAAVAYLVFRFMGTRWIEERFAERLEAYKHAQAKELAELRLRIDSELNRTIKIQEKEFAVLPEAWTKLQDAVASVNSVVSLMQQYPDLNRMNAPQLAAFFETSRLLPVHRDELAQATDKNKYYQEKIFWYDLAEARNSYRDFHVFIKKNSIFLRPALKGQFEKIDSIMWNSLASREVGFGSKDSSFWEKAYDRMDKEVAPLLAELEKQVQDVLHKGT